MKTIGQVLKDARVKKRLSLEKLEDITKIKRSFIAAIEKENWKALPAFPTVLGFVKSLSTTLAIDEKMAVAVLKRDYPPKAESVNPKPDVGSKFVWSPRLTFAVGVGIFLVIIFGYLAFQYARSVSPPALIVDQPKEGQVLKENSVTVSGKTDTDAKVTVNNQPVLTNQDGVFTTVLEVVSQTKEIEIKATSRSGKETVIHRKIEVRI